MESATVRCASAAARSLRGVTITLLGQLGGPIGGLLAAGHDVALVGGGPGRQLRGALTRLASASACLFGSLSRAPGGLVGHLFMVSQGDP